jgi:hypothetical protein
VIESDEEDVAEAHYIAAPVFDGSMLGYVFKLGHEGYHIYMCVCV